MLIHHIESADVDAVSGWAFSKDGAPVLLEVMCEGKSIASASPSIARSDVYRAYPAIQAAATCGFRIPIPSDKLETFASLQLQLSLWTNGHKLNDWTVLKESSLRSLVGDGASLEAGAEAHDVGKDVGPFPLPIMRALGTLLNDKGLRQTTEKTAADAYLALARAPSVISSVVEYARFLRDTWNHCCFVANYFPSVDAKRDDSAKDRNCRQNSAAEIMSIVHQLYVLRSYGVEGIFAEFGCFKGFSSSMLSYACGRLGIEMHIFDSFQGLPESGSDYYQKGDFAGSLEEVRRNISLFGDVNAVSFHKGYFSDSLKVMSVPPIMCLWMDVDLESSAQDVMTVADRLDRRGAIFSHECGPDNFEDGKISAPRGPDSVIPPIVDRFNKMQAPLEGRFIAGNTGSFWRKEGGGRVLANEVLMGILRSI